MCNKYKSFIGRRLYYEKPLLFSCIVSVIDKKKKISELFLYL